MKRRKKRKDKSKVWVSIDGVDPEVIRKFLLVCKGRGLDPDEEYTKLMKTTTQFIVECEQEANEMLRVRPSLRPFGLEDIHGLSRMARTIAIMKKLEVISWFEE